MDFEPTRHGFETPCTHKTYKHNTNLNVLKAKAFYGLIMRPTYTHIQPHLILDFVKDVIFNNFSFRIHLYKNTPFYLLFKQILRPSLFKQQ